jgi:hypothetical protein
MARPKSSVVAARDHEIFALWRQGQSLQELAEQFNISPRRVGQVVAAQHPEEEEDDDRSLYRGYLWRLFEEVRVLYRTPGLKMAPTGRPALDPDGEPAEDTNVKLQAAELELKILESLRKLDARDKPQKSHVTHELAQQQADTWLADVRVKREAEVREMEALRRKAEIPGNVTPGQVVRELPPGGA